MHIDSVDLNLLKALAVLIEERHIGRAAARVHLSRSAMSRILTRLRRTIGDELLVRTPGGYELTPRARTIQDELGTILPRVAALVRGAEFSPATATDAIRAACTDYASTVLLSHAFPQLFEQAPHLSITIEPLSPTTFGDVDRGRLDLALTPVKPPATLRWQPLFADHLVCLLSPGHPLTADPITLAQLAEFPHATVTVLSPDFMIADRILLELGVRPPSSLRVPYFAAAVTALRGTTMIAIMPRRFAELHKDLRIAAAPAELGRPYEYGMTWHPRLDKDPAHQWIRALLVQAGLDITSG